MKFIARARRTSLCISHPSTKSEFENLIYSIRFVSRFQVLTTMNRARNHGPSGMCVCVCVRDAVWYSHVVCRLNLILLTWKIRWAPNNARKWQKGFNSVFKRLRYTFLRNFGRYQTHCTSSYPRMPYQTIRI